jgi:dihydroneopterin aldolase
MKIKEKLPNSHYLTELGFNEDSLENSLDIVYIKNLKGKTVIGICDDELFDPQEIIIDISMGVLNIKACRSDNIVHTIDYDQVRSAVLKKMKNHSYKLLESFAEELANLILDNFNAHWVKINVAKPKKYYNVDSVGIIIERSKVPKRQNNFFNKTQHILRVIGAGHFPKN